MIQYIAKIAIDDPALLHILKTINYCLGRIRINSMAIGGIGAWLAFYKKGKNLNIIYRKKLQWIIFFLTGPSIRLIKHELYSVLFCILIINLASNPNSVLCLENPVLNFLGKISYGIYIYHTLIIGLCFGFLQQINGYAFDDPFSDFILYALTISCTITISTLPYYPFERLFLKRKEQFISEK